ncbi:MAG: SBBP repeat-containing protein, partial [Bryobacterales bacterium]|nr:SBBP repeat-containing protein [Bryobacterales bacterium]
ITTSNDLPMPEGAIQPRYGGGARDVLLGKIAPDGAEWLFLTYLGGTADDWARAVTLDDDGDIYLTGYTTSGSFPRLNSFDTSYNSNRDAFLTKVRSDGSALLYSGFIGHNSLEDGFAIAVNRQKEATIVGHTQSLAFPLNSAVQTAIGSPACRTQPCTADLFIARFSADGRRYLFSSYLGGAGADQSRGVALTPDGEAWITGYTASVNFPFMNGLFPRHTGGGANVAFAIRLSFRD